MLVYIYAADIYCEQCGEVIQECLADAGFAPADPEDEFSYDSDEFPKGPYCDGGGVSDLPHHCGSGLECINAIKLADGRKIGVWLGNKLTSNGIEYVREAIREGGDVAEMWADYYRDYDL